MSKVYICRKEPGKGWRYRAVCQRPVVSLKSNPALSSTSALGCRWEVCLKHSLGVSLVEALVNLAVIKQALGHKSIASTAVYTVPTDETAGKAVTAALASMF